MKKEKPKKRKDRRVNLQLSTELVEWVKTYASQHNTTMTWVIEDCLRDLRKRHSEVPQI